MIQIKTFWEDSSKELDNRVNLWLESREVQNYEIQQITPFSIVQGTYSARCILTIVYDDEPKQKEPARIPRQTPNPTPIRQTL